MRKKPTVGSLPHFNKLLTQEDDLRYLLLNMHRLLKRTHLLLMYYLHTNSYPVFFLLLILYYLLLLLISLYHFYLVLGPEALLQSVWKKKIDVHVTN